MKLFVKVLEKMSQILPNFPKIPVMLSSLLSGRLLSLTVYVLIN